MHLYVLVPGEPTSADVVAIVDAGTGQPLSSFHLDDGIAYRSLAVGPRTGHVFVFGNRGGEALVTLVDAEHGTKLATWTAHAADGHDWRVYAGGVSEDEGRLYLSYHGPDTTGIDWFDVTADGLQRCPVSQRANIGCISAHGAFALVRDRVLAATGLPVIVEVNTAGSIVAGYDTRLEGNHLMEFAVDQAAERVYAVGSCGYRGGFSAVRLDGAGLGPILSHAGDGTWDAVPAPPEVWTPAGVCGERVAISLGGRVVVAKTQQPVPHVGRPGEVLLLDPNSGSVVQTVSTSAEPLDVLVVPLQPT